NTAFHYLLKPLSRHEFETLANQHHVGQRLRSASRWDQFIGMAMAQFSGRQSLRDIQSNQQAQRNKLYHLGAKPIARSTLARLNERQPAALYQTLFYRLQAQCQGLPGRQRFRFKNPLYSLDASMIDLSLKLFPWASYQAVDASVKLSVGLNHGTWIPEFVALGDGRESDLTQGRCFAFPSGSIVVFDKGYVDYQWFKSLTDKGVFFVTRLRAKTPYQIQELRTLPADSAVISDQIIQLSGSRALKREAPRLRLVEYCCPQTGKHYQFLTNHFGLSASTIAAIYKDRWQVELFFKAIKQSLQIKAFVGTSRNAVMTQLWIALIVYLLVAFARYAAQSGWTVQRMLRVLQMNLFERKTLQEILSPDPPSAEERVIQLRLVV
ncbi:MAG: IS4 family transposase, partial [Gallionellaceae bacterium]|nr:IS4 family transposase [Gallionellaceae bacterium]